jgi:preprotein translocase subunit Sss1
MKKRSWSRKYKNFEQLIQAISLMIVSGFAVWGAYNCPMRKEYQYVLLFAATVIGMRGAFEFLQHLDKGE